MKLTEDKTPIFRILLILLAIPAQALVTGILLMVLWLWFIVPLGVISLSLPHAIGIGIIISLFKTNVREKNLEKVAFENITFIAITFLTGFIVHLFM